MAEMAFPSHPRTDDYAMTLAAALYRANRFGEAIQRLNEVNAGLPQAATKTTAYSPAYTWFFLAMAHHRLGHREEARRWLDKAIQRTEQETRNESLHWNRRVTLQLLRREAEELVPGQKN
jgi:tetratricopeptide (TPR) repeat protein